MSIVTNKSGYRYIKEIDQDFIASLWEIHFDDWVVFTLPELTAKQLSEVHNLKKDNPPIATMKHDTTQQNTAQHDTT